MYQLLLHHGDMMIALSFAVLLLSIGVLAAAVARYRYPEVPEEVAYA